MSHCHFVRTLNFTRGVQRLNLTLLMIKYNAWIVCSYDGCTILNILTKACKATRGATGSHDGWDSEKPRPSGLQELTRLLYLVIERRVAIAFSVPQS